jgi:hypothetical protein
VLFFLEADLIRALNIERRTSNVEWMQVTDGLIRNRSGHVSAFSLSPRGVRSFEFGSHQHSYTLPFKVRRSTFGVRSSTDPRCNRHLRLGGSMVVCRVATTEMNAETQEEVQDDET